MDTQLECPICKGTGTNGWNICSWCNGKGIVGNIVEYEGLCKVCIGSGKGYIRGSFDRATAIECSACMGYGYLYKAVESKKECSKCKGTGQLIDEELIPASTMQPAHWRKKQVTCYE